MSKGRILAYRRDRLGGRLRSMINAMRMAKWAEAELRILWPVGRYAQELANPKEFLKAKFVDSYFEMDEEVIESAYATASHIGDFDNFRDIRAHLNAGKDIVVENTKSPIKLPKESQTKANAAFIETAIEITPAVKVQNALARFEKAVDGRKSIAVHVRRGDIIQPGRWSRTYWPTKYVPDEYYDVMIEDDPEAAFLLFSDTNETLERFEAVHGVKSIAKIMKLDGMLESQRDFAELLAISRCSQVYASSESAFSTAATILGGAKKVSLPEDMPKKTKIEAEQRLKSRVLSGPDMFLTLYDYGQCAKRVMDLQSTKPEEKSRIVDTVVENGWELPFVTREFVQQSVINNDDLSVLRVLRAEQNVRKLRRSHFLGSDLLKHTLRRSLLMGFAFAGIGRTAEAARIFSNLVLCQTTICPLDLLSRELKTELLDGRNDIPPTTEIEFFPGQVHPRGLASTAPLIAHYQSRFLPNSKAFNWQTAFDLDWRTLGVNERPMPRKPQIRQVIEVGKQSDDPMKVSLAALAMLRIERLKRAKSLMAKAERMEAPNSTLNKALLLKRRAQVAEAAGNPEIAKRVLNEALQLTDHPAFVGYTARFFMRQRDQQRARETILTTDRRPFYVSWINYELFAFRHMVCDNREEMRQEILDHFKVIVPEPAQVSQVA